MSRFRQPWLVRSVAVIFAASAGLPLAQPAAGGAANDLVQLNLSGPAKLIVNHAQTGSITRSAR